MEMTGLDPEENVVLGSPPSSPTRDLNVLAEGRSSPSTRAREEAGQDG